MNCHWFHGIKCPPKGQAMDKIIEDQEEFEKEHRFMQVWMVLFKFLSSAKLKLKSILH